MRYDFGNFEKPMRAFQGLFFSDWPSNKEGDDKDTYWPNK